jgi:ABC-type transport system involved in multi-copper enzyme maturation permease subunit
MNQVAIVVNLLFMAAFLTFMASWEEEVPPGSFAFFCGIMMAFIPAMVVTREDKYKAMALGCSLPVTRKTIVRSRYLLAVGSAVFGVFFAFLLGSFVPTTRLGPDVLFRLPIVLQALSVTILVISVLLPFTLRFGAMGLILVLAGFQVLGVVALTVVKITESSVDKRLIDGIIETVREIHAWAGPEGFYLLLLVFLMAVVAVSYALSVRVFNRREL